MSEIPSSQNVNVWQAGPGNLTVTPLGKSGRILPLKKNNSLLGKTLDLKISHKKKIYPNQIKIIARSVNSITATGKRKHGYHVENTITGKAVFLTYYEVSRYYLGKNFRKYSIKGNRVSVAPFQITSSPTVKWSDLKFKRYNVLDRVKNRLWDGLTEEQIKAKEEEIKNRAAGPHEQTQWVDPILYNKPGEEK